MNLYIEIKKLAEEFSHTVLHGENIKKNFQGAYKPPVRVSASPRPISAATPVIMGNPAANVPQAFKHDPSKIYKAPVVARRAPSPGALKQSYEKKPPNQAIRKRPATPVAPRASSESNDIVRFSICEKLTKFYYFRI